MPCCVALNLLGCDSLNPAFLSVLDSSGGGTFATLDNAPGHVIITFVNNVTVDERLLSYLETSGAVSLTDEEKQSLHPIVRATVRVNFPNAQQVFEIETITGNTKLVEQGFIAADEWIPPQVFTRVVACDVGRVELAVTETEVFVPAELTAWELIQTTNDAGTVTGTTFEPRTRTPPQFRQLQLDGLDESGDLDTLRNVDIRDQPSAVTNPVCGSVVAFVLEGTLRVPFLERNGVSVSDAPSFDQDDEDTIASIGGRYRFNSSIN